ncbi:PQQ-binding-like beta-propeller repeat protein [Pimelobacter simplex]|uniref:PQQ-binding-like beta-propeller repeat protein n=1 Tax=Nocardioides simplex TaxID=2045 RepID=A0A7J5E241_NOCSI|nr:PQQ-binding-like beta-propeller repeat protein [Pimelobacter simplex]KAB2812332.1 PQQ-binding-like beta-propeller repeat protein [Pimelobacter simplex]
MLLPRLLAGLLLAALLTACDAGDDPGPRPAPALPELESAWTAAGVTGDRAWLVGDLLVVAGKAGLTGLDRATGAVRWTRPLSPGICTTALAPNPDGLLAVVVQRTAKPQTCAAAALVDLHDGALRWRTDLADEHPSRWDRARYDGVGAGDRVVAVTDSVLGAALRLDVRDGAVLSRLDDAEYTTDGPHLVAMTWLDRRRSATVETVATITETDSGRRVRTFRTRDASNLFPVQAAPLVVGTERGQWGSDLYVEHGGQVRVVGRGLGLFTATVDDRVVQGYDGALVVSDAATGEELSAQPLDPQEEVAGVAGDAVITYDRVPGWLPDAPAVLRRLPLDGSGEPVVLGRVRGAALLVADGVAYTAGRDGVRAYRLPAEGTPTSAYLDRLAWREGDLRPAEVFDACRAVSGETLAQVGLAADERVDASCWWGGGRRFSVTVEAGLPEAPAPAREDGAEDVPGLGDNAWLVERSRALELTVRLRNVTVRVTATATDVRPGVLEAAREVLAALEDRG